MQEVEKLSASESQIIDEMTFLMDTLPLEGLAPRWRRDWYFRLQQLSETEGEVNYENNKGWLSRVSDYQLVSAHPEMSVFNKNTHFSNQVIKVAKPNNSTC